MSEYSFYKVIRHRNAKQRQSICSSWQVVCKDANAEINKAL